MSEEKEQENILLYVLPNFHAWKDLELETPSIRPLGTKGMPGTGFLLVFETIEELQEYSPAGVAMHIRMSKQTYLECVGPYPRDWKEVEVSDED